MNKPKGIIIFGANGSGKTTLGRELARILKYKYMDHEDYAFNDSEIPYTNERPHEECTELLFADIKRSCGFVLSAVTGDFGGEVLQHYNLAVFISAPLEVCVERIRQREYDKFGDRVCEGGDMYEQHLKFVDFVTTRSLKHLKEWEETLMCPIINVDGTKDYKRTAADIAVYFTEKL